MRRWRYRLVCLSLALSVLLAVFMYRLLRVRDDATEKPEPADGSDTRPVEAHGTQEGSQPSATKPVKENWRRRKTVRQRRREFTQPSSVRAQADQRDNERTRLPLDETVCLGGLVLVEAFTPSTIKLLYATLEKLPVDRPGTKQEWISQLQRFRSSPGRAAWQSIGLVRRPGEFRAGPGFSDSTLPSGVDAVWLTIIYPAPSLTLLVATFTFEEDASDVSDILRSNYETVIDDIHVRVNGRFGLMRQRIPWSRPSKFYISGNYYDVARQKRQAYDRRASQHEQQCWDWLSTRFNGRFIAEPMERRPTLRLLFTKKSVPFVGHSEALGPLGLNFFPTVWRSTDVPGWGLVLHDALSKQRPFIATVAARRADAAERGRGEQDGSIWRLTYDFHLEQSTLAALLGVQALLSIYTDQLSRLRDRAGIKPRIGRPVRQARDLDGFLLGDGLDAVTVASDLKDFTEELSNFRWNVAEYMEDVQGIPESIRNSREAAQLVPNLRDTLHTSSIRLIEDIAATTTNVSASAQLRQAVANTRLQRTVVTLAVIATIASVISLVIAANGS